MGKNILVPCLDVIMIAFLPEKDTVRDHISIYKTTSIDYYARKKKETKNGVVRCHQEYY